MKIRKSPILAPFLNVSDIFENSKIFKIDDSSICLTKKKGMTRARCKLGTARCRRCNLGRRVVPGSWFASGCRHRTARSRFPSLTWRSRSVWGTVPRCTTVPRPQLRRMQFRFLLLPHCGHKSRRSRRCRSPTRPRNSPDKRENYSSFQRLRPQCNRFRRSAPLSWCVSGFRCHTTRSTLPSLTSCS